MHFDVVLPEPDEPRLAEEGALFENEALLELVVDHLEPHLAAFRSLFEPRQRK